MRNMFFNLSVVPMGLICDQYPLAGPKGPAYYQVFNLKNIHKQIKYRPILTLFVIIIFRYKFY